jgi:hypothetical protein
MALVLRGTLTSQEDSLNGVTAVAIVLDIVNRLEYFLQAFLLDT